MTLVGLEIICVKLNEKVQIRPTCNVRIFLLLNSSRPPSVRVDHGYSILIVCLAGASATMTVKANA